MVEVKGNGLNSNLDRVSSSKPEHRMGPLLIPGLTVVGGGVRNDVD